MSLGDDGDDEETGKDDGTDGGTSDPTTEVGNGPGPVVDHVPTTTEFKEDTGVPSPYRTPWGRGPNTGTDPLWRSWPNGGVRVDDFRGPCRQ